VLSRWFSYIFRGRAVVALLLCLGGIRLVGSWKPLRRPDHWPPAFPHVGRPFQPSSTYSNQRLTSHIISIVGGGVSFLMRCLGSPPAPHGATCLLSGGGTSSGVPRDPPHRSPQLEILLTIIKVFN